MAELTIRYVPVDDLDEDPENPKAHDLDEIAASIARFGFVDPALHDGRTGRLIAGIGIDDAGGWTVPVVYGWESASDDEARAALVALNQTTIKGGYDEPALLSILDRLAEVNDGMVGTGFDNADYDALRDRLAEIGTEPPVPTPIVVPDDAVTEVGDLWEIGPHRILCGDGTDPSCYATVLDGARADLVVTDPPYGVEYVGKTKDALTIQNDDLTGEALAAFVMAAFKATRDVTRPGACWYVFAPSGVDYRHFLNALADLDVARHGLVWVKDRFVMGRADYHYRHENVVYGWTPGAAHQHLDARTFDTVLEHDRPGASVDHPTMKPVALLERMILNSSRRREIVLDPFGGSGSTAIAADRQGRHARLIELDPRYVDVIVRRLAAETGQEATRQDGTAFPVS